ncbi:MAG TPA: hypothetical protein VFZ80_03175 [Acidimicrobiia bacterium]
MISIESLAEHLAGDWVAFDKYGNVLDYIVPNDIGPATLAVSPVTDALKEVDEADRVVGSVDKNAVWSVDAIVLNSIVLRRLPNDAYEAEDLIQAVRDAGFSWQISPTSVP